VTGHCHSPSVYLIRGHGNPSTFLLHSIGGTVPERCSVRRVKLVYPPLQDPIQGDAVARAGPGGFPGGNREKERKRAEKELRRAGKAAGVKPIISQNLQLRQHPRCRTRARSIGEETGVYHRRSVHGRQFVFRWWLQKIRMDHCLEPTETRFTVPSPSEPPHVTTVPPPPTTSTSGFRSRGWTTLDVPPSASTPNRPLTPNVDR